MTPEPDFTARRNFEKVLLKLWDRASVSCAVPCEFKWCIQLIFASLDVRCHLDQILQSGEILQIFQNFPKFHRTAKSGPGGT